MNGILRLASLTTILMAVAGCTGPQGVPGPPGPPGPSSPAGPGGETVDATSTDAGAGDVGVDVTTLVDSGADSGVDATTLGDSGGTDSGVDVTALVDSSADADGEPMDVVLAVDAGEDAVDAAPETGSDSAADAEAGPPCTEAACAFGSCLCVAASDAGVPAPTVLATDAMMTGSLVADGTGVYWANEYNINKAPLDGGAVTQLLAQPIMNSPQVIPDALAIQGGWVYWVSTDVPVFMSLVYGTPAVGASGQQYQIGAFGGTNIQIHPSPTAMAIDTTGIYWICVGGNNSSTLTEIPNPNGGTDAGLQMLAQGYNFSAVAARNGIAYYVDSAVLKSVPVAGSTACSTSSGHCPSDAGGTPTVLDTCSTTYTPVVDDSFVYYNAGGDIRRVPVAGGAPTVVVPSNGGLLAIDATNIYWVDGSFVYRAPLTGGCPQPLAFGSWSPAAIAVDATSVYWTDMNKTQVLKIAK
jgi:hypothetical protein